MRKQQPHPNQLLAWLNNTLNVCQVSVQQLGNGVSYCFLLNQQFPLLLPMRQVIIKPRIFEECVANLRTMLAVANALKLGLLGFDIFRAASGSFDDNFMLLSKLHSFLQQKQTPSTMKPKLGYSSQIGIQMPATSLNYAPKLTLLPQEPLHQCLLPQKGTQPVVVNRIDEIKVIVNRKDTSDRIKVRELKMLLGMEIDDTRDTYEQQTEKDLLSQSHRPAQIVIDQPSQ